MHGPLPLLTLLLAFAEAQGAGAEAAPSPPATETRLDLGTGPIPAGVARDLWQIELMRLAPASLAAFVSHDEAPVRARAARALGRLRTGRAMPMVTSLLSDPNPQVRREAAVAAGQTPGAGAALESAWLTEREPAVRAAILRALGRQGRPEAADVLIPALEGPLARDAATALGHMGVRGLAAVRQPRVVDALLDVVEDPWRLVARRRAAWAVGRAGLTAASPNDLARMRVRIVRDGDDDVRVPLLRAWAPLASRTSRAEVLTALASSPSPRVRLATLRALPRARFEHDDAVVVRLLGDPDAAVRREAISLVPTVARGRARLLLTPAWTGADVDERAAALRAMADSHALPASLGSLVDADQPVAFRIAVLPAVTDPARLADLACGADAPALRSAAAERLLALDPYPLPQATALLACRDEAVVQAVAETLEAHPDPSLERPLLDLLSRADLPNDAAFAAVRALDAVYGTGRLPRPGPSVARTLARWLTAPRLREERGRLATLLGIPAPPEAHPTLAVPDLSEVLRIRGARVWTTEGELRVDLHAEDAPYAAWNFARLAEAGRYDGLRFHRVIPDFVAQGGDPREDGWGGPGWVVPDEVDDTPYGPGTLGMALSGPDTGGSQWFVALTDQPHLDGDYTAFGHLVEGLDVARRLTPSSRIVRITIERG